MNETPIQKHTKQFLKHLIGWLCIVLGIIMLITPGQGILTILIGIYLLADQVPFFGRIRRHLHHRFPRFAQFVQREKELLSKKFKRSARR